jgi:hypothetical protein
MINISDWIKGRLKAFQGWNAVDTSSPPSLNPTDNTNSSIHLPSLATVLHHINIANWFRLLDKKTSEFSRFSLLFKLVLLIPMLTWLILFQFSKYIPHPHRPKIDVSTLPRAETSLLLGYSLQHFPRSELPENQEWSDFLSFLDLLSAGAYLIHFAMSWIFALFLYLYYRKKQMGGKPIAEPWTYLWCFGFLNMFAVVTQLAWPTAPPWYLEYYGERPANYNMSGDPAGLTRADRILNYPLFTNLYGNSPIVFGSFPSLHGAWPIMITIFAPPHRVLKVGGGIYVGLVWWAAMYLNHHFLLDLLGGAAYVLFAYFVGMSTIKILKAAFKDKMLSGAASKFAFKKLAKDDGEIEDYLPEIELAIVENDNIINSSTLKKTMSHEDVSLLEEV